MACAIRRRRSSWRMCCIRCNGIGRCCSSRTAASVIYLRRTSPDFCTSGCNTWNPCALQRKLSCSACTDAAVWIHPSGQKRASSGFPVAMNGNPISIPAGRGAQCGRTARYRRMKPWPCDKRRSAHLQENSCPRSTGRWSVP